MRVTLTCATAALFGAVLALGCTNTTAVAPDSKPKPKADTKKNDAPPESKRADTPTEKAAEPWGTVSGRVTWREKALPALPALAVIADVAHCTSRGPIPDEKWVVNKDNKGVKNVFVWLVDLSGKEPKAPPIHPSLKEIKEKEVVMDQPCCKFEPRVVAVRVGQTLVAKNSSPINHNFNYQGGDDNSGNRLVAAGGTWEITLNASHKPVAVSCNIHPWMKGWIRVFDHPYYAVTDGDGKFAITKAPAGKYHLVMWHEECGWVSGGKRGKPVEVRPGDVTEVNEAAPPAAE